MKRQHVLDHKLRRIAMLAVDVPLDVEADARRAFGEQAVRPASKARIEVDGERFPHPAVTLPAATVHRHGIRARAGTAAPPSQTPPRPQPNPQPIGPMTRRSNKRLVRRRDAIARNPHPVGKTTKRNLYVRRTRRRRGR